MYDCKYLFLPRIEPTESLGRLESGNYYIYSIIATARRTTGDSRVSGVGGDETSSSIIIGSGPVGSGANANAEGSSSD